VSRVVHLPTLSGMQRAAQCPASEALRVRVHTSSEHAERGTEIHNFIDAVATGRLSREEALRVVPDDWLGVCVNLDLEAVYGDLDAVRTEVAYAIDTASETVRCLGDHLGRNYPTRLPTEAAGTLDVVGVRRENGRPVVRDVKTGFLEVEPAETNWQTRAFAYCLQLETGAEFVDGEIVYVRENGAVDIDPATFDADNLASVPAELADIRRRIMRAVEVLEETGRAEFFPSEEACKYCPVQLACPAKVAIVRSLVTDVDAVVAGQFDLMSPEELGRAWDTYERLRKPFEAVEKALKDIAKHRGIDLADGRHVRAIEVHKSRFSKDAALSLLRELGATELQLAACTKEAVELHVRALGKKKKTQAA